VQAAIADLHVQQPRDWEQIALLYRRLERLTGSPIVTLNGAVAVAEVEGPEPALALLEGLDLDGYLYFHSTRADFLRRLGRDDEAHAAYARALALAETEPEHRFLQSRLKEFRPPPAGC
jgi:RNA polymerase sigma-70 factor, ECF subfamily